MYSKETAPKAGVPTLPVTANLVRVQRQAITGVLHQIGAILSRQIRLAEVAVPLTVQALHRAEVAPTAGPAAQAAAAVPTVDPAQAAAAAHTAVRVHQAAAAVRTAVRVHQAGAAVPTAVRAVLRAEAVRQVEVAAHRAAVQAALPGLHPVDVKLSSWPGSSI